ncbi:C2 calcium-dependent domain-containing protein 6-like isoform X3 [Xenia sp. Carnegie-2017]|nr:C2 calcium-dependent domain-containing protein 6-like isoform X3 [Xenia sp. Carnegie-2017]
MKRNDVNEGEVEANPTLLIEDREDAFLTLDANIPVGVLSVHVFGCQQLIMDGDSIPDTYRLYGNISVGSLAKNTSETMRKKKGKILWNEVLNLPVGIASQMKHWSNQIVFSVLGFHKDNKNKLKMIGKVSFHLHKLVKIGWSMESYELTNRKKQKVGTVELEFAFAYGALGYGYSNQLENYVCSTEEAIRQSMLPRVHPVEKDRFSKWCILKAKETPHPYFLPFTEMAIDLKPDIYDDDSETCNVIPLGHIQLIRDLFPR